MAEAFALAGQFVGKEWRIPVHVCAMIGEHCRSTAVVYCHKCDAPLLGLVTTKPFIAHVPTQWAVSNKGILTERDELLGDAAECSITTATSLSADFLPSSFTSKPYTLPLSTTPDSTTIPMKTPDVVRIESSNEANSACFANRAHCFVQLQWYKCVLLGTCQSSDSTWVYRCAPCTFRVRKARLVLRAWRQVAAVGSR